MSKPAHYRYDPPWELVALEWILFAGVLVALGTRYLTPTIGLPASLVLAAFGFLTALRRFAFRRNLVLDEQAIWLPNGFLRMNVQRVGFDEISDAWEQPFPFAARWARVIFLRAHKQTFEVHSMFLPDPESYHAVGDEIFSRLNAMQP